MAFVLPMLTEALRTEAMLTEKCGAEIRRAPRRLVTAMELVLDGRSEHEARMLLGSFVLGGAECQRVR